MRRLRRAGSHLLFAAIVGLVPVVVACASTGNKPPAVAEQKPKERNAHQIALRIIDGKIGTMLEMDRIADRPAAQRLVHSGLLGSILEGTGIDVLRDTKRVFVASTGITQQDKAVVVVWHRLSEEKLRAALASVVERDGEWLKDSYCPAARVTVSGHPRLVAMIAPEYVAILPTANHKSLQEFASTGGLPEPEGPEGAVAIIEEPSTSLRARQVPRIPETIRRAVVKGSFGQDGSIALATQGESTSSEQAVQDAQVLQDNVASATSLKLGFVSVRLFKRIDFRAEGRSVQADLHLSSKELDTLLGMARAFLAPKD